MKKKIIMAFIVLFVIAGSAFIYNINKRSSTQKIPFAPNPVFDEEQRKEEALAVNKQDKSSKQVSILTVNGIVQSISDGKIEIKNGETNEEFALDSGVKIVNIDGSKIESRNASDIKKDQKVSLLINQDNSEVISIQILVSGSFTAF